MIGALATAVLGLATLLDRSEDQVTLHVAGYFPPLPDSDIAGPLRTGHRFIATFQTPRFWTLGSRGFSDELGIRILRLAIPHMRGPDMNEKMREHLLVMEDEHRFDYLYSWHVHVGGTVIPMYNHSYEEWGSNKDVQPFTPTEPELLPEDELEALLGELSYTFYVEDSVVEERAQSLNAAMTRADIWEDMVAAFRGGQSL